MEIPNIDLAYNAVIEAHAKIPKIKLIFWDIVLDENENPVIIEANMRHPTISVPQLANRESFFGDCVDEIIEYCNKQNKLTK